MDVTEGEAGAEPLQVVPIKLYYVFPDDDTPIEYRCILRTYQPDGKVIYIPLVKEPHLSPEQKIAKYESYKGIRGMGAHDTKLDVIGKKRDETLFSSSANNYDELIGICEGIISSPADRPLIETYFHANNVVKYKVKQFEESLDITRLAFDTGTNSQVLKFTDVQADFVLNAHLGMPEFTLPFYALPDSIFLSLQKLKKFIEEDPDLLVLYKSIQLSQVFTRFKSKNAAVAGSRPLKDYIADQTLRIDVNGLQATHLAFKGIVEVVSKIHDKPERRFVTFMLECLEKMKKTLNHRGFVDGSYPFRMLNDLIGTFRNIMRIYIGDVSKDQGSGVSQEKCRDVINEAVKQFEEFVRNVYGCPIDPWVPLGPISRTRSKVKKLILLQKAKAGLNLEETSGEASVVQTKLIAVKAGLGDAVGDDDLQALKGDVSNPLVMCLGNGMRGDGSPPSFDSKFPWVALFMDYTVVSTDGASNIVNLDTVTTRYVGELYENNQQVHLVNSSVTAVSTNYDTISNHNISTHTCEFGRFAALVDPLFDVTQREFTSAFKSVNDTEKTKIFSPFLSLYMLYDSLPERFKTNLPYFLGKLSKFSGDVQRLFSEGIQRRKTAYNRFDNFYKKKLQPFPSFVIIDGLLYVLVCVTDTLNGGISNNMTMYLICKKFPDAASFRGRCDSAEGCASLFKQSGCIVLDHFEDLDKDPKFKETKDEWNEILCEIGFNLKEFWGDQFKRFFAELCNTLGIVCLFGSVDICLIFGLAGDNIPLALIRSIDNWRAFGTSTLPELSDASVKDIAIFQLLFLLYGSFNREDGTAEKKTKLKTVMTKLNDHFAGTSSSVVDELVKLAEDCRNKLKTNIQTCYQTPEINALKDRLEIFKRVMRYEIALPRTDPPPNFTRLLRIYLVYLKYFNKVLADSKRLRDGTEDTLLLLEKDKFVSLIANPITGRTLDDQPGKGYVCNDLEGFKNLVVNSVKTDEFETFEILMDRAGAEEKDNGVAFTAILNIIPNDTSLAEIFATHLQEDGPDPASLVTDVECTLKRLLIKFDVFQLLELLQYLEVKHKDTDIALKGPDGTISSRKRGSTLKYKTLISVLHDCISVAFELYVEDLDQTNDVLQYHIQAIQKCLSEMSGSCVKSQSTVAAEFKRKSSRHPPTQSTQLERDNMDDGGAVHVMTMDQFEANPNPNKRSNPGPEASGTASGLSLFNGVRASARKASAAITTLFERGGKQKGGSRKYTKRTKKFKRTLNKRNKTIRNKINTKYSLRNTIKRRKTRRRK